MIFNDPSPRREVPKTIDVDYTVDGETREPEKKREPFFAENASTFAVGAAAWLIAHLFFNYFMRR